jgi:cardiolipin synthase (CMP-forming)
VPQSFRQQVPNLLSTLRIVLAMAFPFLNPSLRLPVILIALASEFFDGYLARRWNAETLLGQSLDPIADKLFVLSTVATLIHEGGFTWLQFVLIAMRDIVVAVGSFTTLLRSAREMNGRAIEHLKPKFSGKLATTLQFALLISLFAGWPTSGVLFIATAFMSCLSAVDYTYTILHRRWNLAIQ